MSTYQTQFLRSCLLSLLVLASTAIAHALPPTLSITPSSDSTSATVTVTDAQPGSAVNLYFTSGFTNAIQNQTIGITSATGSLVTAIGQDTYNISKVYPVYVMVNNTPSEAIAWPLTTTAKISTLTFSTTSQFLAQGKSTTVTVSGDTGPYSIKSTTNPNAAISSLSGNTISIYGNNTGSSAITVCSGRNICADLTISVIVSTSTSVLPISITIPIKVGETLTFPLTGGDGAYYLTTPIATPFRALITGKFLTIAGVSPGTNIATVCTSISVCQVFMFTVSPQTQSTPMFSEPSATAQQSALGKAEPVTQPLSTSRYVFTKGLSPGMKSNEVLELQKRLQLEGYLENTPNGYYGAGTTAAVKAFQTDNGLTPLGSVGPGTRAALNRE